MNLARTLISKKVEEFLKKDSQLNNAVNESINQVSQQGASSVRQAETVILIPQILESEGTNTNAASSNSFNFSTTTSVNALGGGETPPHPWKISLRTEEDVVQYKVELNSALYSGLGSFTNIAVTGLNFWAAASEGYLYLFGVIEDGECTEASIQGPEEIPSDRIEFIDDEQNSFSTIIGYIYEDENENLLVKQDAFHNFTLIQTCVDGKAALYPFAT